MHLKSPKSYQLATSVLLACFHVGSAWAQPELVYQSSFENYQPYSASTIRSWKQTNDTVNDRGGWRAYAKEITQDADAQPSTAVHSHGGHP